MLWRGRYLPAVLMLDPGLESAWSPDFMLGVEIGPRRSGVSTAASTAAAKARNAG